MHDKRAPGMLHKRRTESVDDLVRGAASFAGVAGTVAPL